MVELSAMAQKASVACGVRQVHTLMIRPSTIATQGQTQTALIGHLKTRYQHIDIYLHQQDNPGARYAPG